MSDTGKAVFISYASQDAEAAKRICEALRAAGVEVWFDQSELRGGDAWDQKIRRQIKECALFMPVISANTNARPEGYFRLEWKLAVDRSHLMADDAPFLFPIVIGDVSDAAARVPDKFRDVQWTRLRLDETPAELAKRVGRLLSAEDGAQRTEDRARRTENRAQRKGRIRWNWWMIFPILGSLMGMMFAFIPLWKMMREPASRPPPAVAPPTPAAPAISEARQLALKARKLAEGIDSTMDDLKAAEGLLQRAVTLDPTDGFILAVYSRLNTSFAMRGFEFSPARQEEARSQMERAVRLAPEEAEVWLARGSYLRRTSGDRAEAEKALRKAIELAPQDTRPWFDLAWAIGQPGNSANDNEILAMLDKSIDPARPGSDALAHYNQFLLLFGSRRFAEADAKVRQSVDELASANFVTGLVRSELTWKGDADAAVIALGKLSADKRKETRSVWFAAYAHLLARQPEATLADLRLLPGDFIEDSFFSGPKAYWEGRAQQQLGNADAARVAWETALAVSRREGPGRAQRGLLMQAELLAYLGRPEEALQAVHAYEQATTGGRKRGQLAWISSSARIHVLMGRLDDALPLIEADLKAGGVAWPLTPALLKIDPVWDRIRGDARFQKLVEDQEENANNAPAVAPPGKSIAVLAFANLSDDKANEYFSDGISEELLNVLAKVPGLKVSARTSAFHFKGKDTPIQEIARQLGVAYVVEGSVRKAGTRVRITAQLIKAADGFHVWSEDFDRELKDVFAVQDEIAGLIAKNLRLKLDDSARPARPIDPEAHKLYLQGRQALLRRTDEGFEKAKKLFEQARAIEPEWASVYAGLADVSRLSEFADSNANGPDTPWSPAMLAAKALGERALALDPSLAEAYVALGGTYMLGWNLAKAEELELKALQLNPNLADAYLALGRIYSAQGRMDETIEAFRRAADLNPLAPRILDNLAAQLEFAGRFEEGWKTIERATALQPTGSQIQCYRARLLLSLGRREEALRQARQLADNPDEDSRYFRLIEAAAVYAKLGKQAEAEALVAQIPDNRAEKVIAYGYLGRPQDAMPVLDHLNFSWIDDLLWGRGFDPVRNDPRLQAYQARVGLAEAAARAQAWRAAHPIAAGGRKTDDGGRK